MTAAEVLVDTNIVSYTMRGGREALACEPHLAGKLLAISFITVGELYCWAETNQWGERRRAHLEERLRNFVVIPYDHQVARLYGIVAADRKRSGRPIECPDAWIAACALRHSIPLVTHNARDFELIDHLQVITEAVREA